MIKLFENYIIEKDLEYLFEKILILAKYSAKLDNDIVYNNYLDISIELNGECYFIINKGSHSSIILSIDQETKKHLLLGEYLINKLSSYFPSKKIFGTDLIFDIQNLTKEMVDDLSINIEDFEIWRDSERFGL